MQVLDRTQDEEGVLEREAPGERGTGQEKAGQTPPNGMEGEDRMGMQTERRQTEDPRVHIRSVKMVAGEDERWPKADDPPNHESDEARHKEKAELMTRMLDRRK